MSYDIVVYLKRANMPSPDDWQKAIVDAGFNALLHNDFDPDSFGGFLPCPVNGQAAGFEYYPSILSPNSGRNKNVPMDADFSILFCIGRQPLELISALASATVLAEISGGVFCDPQEGKILASQDAVTWAKTRLEPQ